MGKHSALRPGNLQILQERDRHVRRLLVGAGLDDLASLRVFEAGCGEGRNLLELLRWGALAENMTGVDLDASRIEDGRSLNPAVRLEAASADSVDLDDDAVDLSLAFTLFSSVPDDSIAQAIAGEMLRVTRPGGLVLVYDMRRRSPNPAVRPITAEQIRSWFGDREIESTSLTLAPPLARSPVGRSVLAYGLLAALPPLRTHQMHAVAA